jgi:BolA protein
MTSRIDKIQQALINNLQATQLEIIDDSHKHIGHAGAENGMGHFTVKIASPLFADLTLIEKHRLIYQALDE